MRRLFLPFLPLFLCLCAYWAVCGAYSAVTGDLLAAGLGWNLLLSALPLCFARLAARCRPAAGRAALLALWLLFLPNAFYFLTDLLHTPSGMEWLTRDSAGRVTVEHSMLASEWLLLLVIGVGTFFSLVLGLLAMDFCYERLRRFSRRAALAGVGAVSLLCGFGIYIGRFLRLNSWDVLHPARLAQKLLAAASPAALRLCALFGGAVLLLFGIWRAVRALAVRGCG